MQPCFTGRVARLPPLAVVLGLALAGRAGAIDFLRGDVNGDGIVSLGDLHLTDMYLYGGSPPPECLMAADVDDDEHIGYRDRLILQGSLIAPEFWPPLEPPHPEPGPDPTQAIPDPESPAVTCEGYGGGSVLEDPVSRIEVRDAVAAGGQDAVAGLTVVLTSPLPSAGFMGRLKVAGDIIGHRNPNQRSREFLPDSFNFWGTARITGDSVVFFSLVNVLRRQRPLPAAEEQEILEITLCLRPGARAGVYPITLEMAEIVEWRTGRSIRPSIAAGTLTLTRDVASTTDSCSAEDEPSDAVDIEFRIGDAAARPGGTFRVPFSIRPGAPVYIYGFSIDFNEDVLECTSLEPVWQRPDGLPYPFENHDINNRSVRPGNGEPDEGAVMGVIPCRAGPHRRPPCLRTRRASSSTCTSGSAPASRPAR